MYDTPKFKFIFPLYNVKNIFQKFLIDHEKIKFKVLNFFVVHPVWYFWLDSLVGRFSPRTLKVKKEFNILESGFVSFSIAGLGVGSNLVVVFDKGKVECIGMADCFDCDLFVYL